MGSLLDFFDRARITDTALIAGWVIATEGSTYRKPGALMLFTREQREGLLSGGCLEDDLHEHARKLLNDDTARTSLHRYDSRGSDDPVWGLGLGCEGLMQVLLLRCDSTTRYEPLCGFFAAQKQRRPFACAIDPDCGVFVSINAQGVVYPESSNQHERLLQAARLRLGNEPDASSRPPRDTDAGLDSALFDGAPRSFSFRSETPPALLICGAGPDVEPVFNLAKILGWHVTVVDHRPAYVDHLRFSGATGILCIENPADLGTELALESFSAALVMSHHLQADGNYLTALARSPIAYLGLLGPAARRERLFAELGERIEPLRARLRAPVGLDLGARTPEEIALAIIAEIQAHLRGREARSFTTVIAHPYTE